MDPCTSHTKVAMKSKPSKKPIANGVSGAKELPNRANRGKRCVFFVS